MVEFKPPFYMTLSQLHKRGVKRTFHKFLRLLLPNLIPHFRKKMRYISYRFFSSEKSVIVHVNGSEMWLNLGDKGINDDLFLYEKREPICTDYLMNLGVLKEGEEVLDIGANIGYYVLIESNLVGDSGKVYAIEPVFSNIKALKSNIKLNNCENVEIFRLAVSDKDGKSRIYVSDRSNLSAMEKSRAGGKVIGAEEVEVVTLDSFFKDKNISSFIRMDVEGYEYNIIKGMAKTLKEARTLKI
jgi:FkbM family methyltransferase